MGNEKRKGAHAVVDDVDGRHPPAELIEEPHEIMSRINLEVYWYLPSASTSMKSRPRRSLWLGCQDTTQFWQREEREELVERDGKT